MEAGTLTACFPPPPTHTELSINIFWIDERSAWSLRSLSRGGAVAVGDCWCWGELLGLASSQAAGCGLFSGMISLALVRGTSSFSVHSSLTYIWVSGGQGLFWEKQICPSIQVTAFFWSAAEPMTLVAPSCPQISVRGLIRGPYKLLSPRSVWSPFPQVVFIWCHFPGHSDSKESACRCGRPRFTWVGKTFWRRKWQPTPVFLPGKFHGQSLASYSHGVAKSRTRLNN